MERSVEYRGAGVRQLLDRHALHHRQHDRGVRRPERDLRGRRGGRPRGSQRRASDHKRRAAATSAPTPTRPTSSASRSISPSLEPQVAKPFSPDNVRGVTELAGTALHGVFIGACTTTEEELVLGALVLEPAMKTGGARRRRTSSSSCPAISPSRRTCAQAGCGRSTRRPASASIRRAARCAWAWPREKARPRREVALLAEPQLPEPHGRGLARAGSPAAHGARRARGDEDRRSAAAARAASIRSGSGASSASASRGARRRCSGAEPEVQLAPAARRGVGEAGPPRRRQRAARSARGSSASATTSTPTRSSPASSATSPSSTELGAKAFHFVRPDFVARVQDGATHRGRRRGLGLGAARASRRCWR